MDEVGEINLAKSLISKFTNSNVGEGKGVRRSYRCKEQILNNEKGVADLKV